MTAHGRTAQVTTTYFDGFRNEALLGIQGFDADKKALATAAAIFARTRRMLELAGLGDYSETYTEVLGASGAALEEVYRRAQRLRHRVPAGLLHSFPDVVEDVVRLPRPVQVSM